MSNPPYYAPEQFENPEAMGPPVDVFALGVVLYQLLTHQLPYQYGNDPKYYYGQLPAPEQHDIPEPLYQILWALLHQEPVFRPSALELHNQLQAYLATLSGNIGKKNSGVLQAHVIFCTLADRVSFRAELDTVQFLVENLNTSIVGNYRILVNYNLPMHGADSREIDIIVVNKFGVFLIEVKAWIGLIEAFSDFWIVDGNYKRDNPLEAINAKARILHTRIFGNRAELRDLHNVSIAGLVLLTQGTSRFKNSSDRDAKAVVGPGHQLLRALTSTELLQRGFSSRMLDDADIQRVTEILYEKHQARKEVLIGNYRILKELSFGDLFNAYEAQDVHIDTRRVRLKRYQLLKLSQPQMNEDIRHFKRNAEVISALGPHPHILNTFDFFQDPNRPDVFYEVTELATGGRLDEIMAQTRKSLSLEDQLDYLEPLCAALAHAHNHKSENGKRSPVYHCNVSPETIFVTKDKIVKLADFDFAKFGPHTIDRGIDQGYILIGKSYTAPEVLLNTSTASPTRDIYALGVLWYFLACLPAQHPKFDAKNAETEIDALQLPEAARTLMKRLVARLPANRPQNIEEVLNELKQLKT